VGECGIIDRDSLIPIPPETISPAVSVGIKEREFGLSRRQQMVFHSNSWLLRLMAIGNQSAQDVDKAVDRRTMPRMLNL